MKNHLALILMTAVLLGAFSSLEAAPLPGPLKGYMAKLEDAAKKEDSSFKGFSAEAGKILYFKEMPHPEAPSPRSCATCHGKDLSQKGSHAISGKIIEPLLPSVNKERLTEVKKVKKWFRRNCKWVKQGPCTAREKGDFLLFLLNP